ncbi:MAG: hypothetical protein JW781_02340 [Deltaproteobacteria bacterium]|nr:hypothetical protein [Candidatus Anaeroferrophillacea bacterium]
MKSTAPPSPADNPPVCGRCRHYYVTWDPRHPHGCRALGFKSAALPSAVVQRTSGRACEFFRPRPGHRR